MKTIGERIRQARETRGLSQAELARLAGFKGQSAIGNIENRATGRGGFNLSKIAAVLEVPLTWLLDGPDTESVPGHADQRSGLPSTASVTPPPSYTELDKIIVVLRRLPPKALAEAAQYVDYLAVKHNAPSSNGADHPVPAPRSKAA